VEHIMNKSNADGVNRRDVLKGVAGASLVGAAASTESRAGSAGHLSQRQVTATRSHAALIRDENAKPGARDWQLTRVRLDRQGGLRSPPIEGYCSRQSVAAGESIDFIEG
jgi:hypothetical protein